MKNILESTLKIAAGIKANLLIFVLCTVAEEAPRALWYFPNICSHSMTVMAWKPFSEICHRSFSEGSYSLAKPNAFIKKIPIQPLPNGSHIS